MMKWVEIKEGQFTDLVVEYFDEKADRYEEIIVGTIKEHFGEFMVTDNYGDEEPIICKSLERAKKVLIKECRNSAMDNLETSRIILNGLSKAER